MVDIFDILSVRHYGIVRGYLVPQTLKAVLVLVSSHFLFWRKVDLDKVGFMQFWRPHIVLISMSTISRKSFLLV